MLGIPPYLEVFHLLLVIFSTNSKFNDSFQLWFSLLINVLVSMCKVKSSLHDNYSGSTAPTVQDSHPKESACMTVKVLRLSCTSFLYCPKAILLVVQLDGGKLLEGDRRTGETNPLHKQQRFLGHDELLRS